MSSHGEYRNVGLIELYLSRRRYQRFLERYAEHAEEVNLVPRCYELGAHQCSQSKNGEVWEDSVCRVNGTNGDDDP